MTLPQWHAWPLLMVLTLAGDVLCAALALFGDLTGRYRMPHIFWWILWIAQVPLALQVVGGVVLFVGGARPRTPLHVMYGGLIVLTLLALYALRLGGGLRRGLVKDEHTYRESRWLLLLCLFLAGLVGRAYMTGAMGR
ncbi:MAG TPA: hypothetical protein VFW01_08085 [bacterium]|nr:hypothetical protein [bacterium]